MEHSAGLPCLPRWLAAIAAATMLAIPAGAARAAAPEKITPETCKTCHKAYYETFAASIHGKAAHPNSPARFGGCEACHGDAREHVAQEGGRGVGGLLALSSRSLSAEDKSEPCLACHSSGRHLALWGASKHKSNDVACSDCHDIHGEPRPARQHEACFTCHKDIRNQASKLSHHPIVEGKVKCTDCHNPHGSVNLAMLKADSVNQTCYGCHGDKRGPVAWPHPPVEENCLSCHHPHGGKNAKMLREKIPNLCEDCHDWGRHPGSIYDGSTGFRGLNPSSRMFARSCLNCHGAIHGSNSPGTTGKRFLQ